MSLTNTYNDGFKRIDPQSLDFSEAPYFRKVENLSLDSLRIATSIEEIQTVVDGKDETKNIANPGDYIITGPKGELYILTEDKFNKMYELSPDDDDMYRSKNHGYAIQVTEDVVIAASWGEDQKIYAGGVIFKSAVNGDVYGNQASTFESTFGRQAINGDIIPLTASLDDQRIWAESLGEMNHLRDIQSRIAQQTALNPQLASNVLQQTRSLENK